ncbi:unnamed protein product [Phytomonas sp. Hart1]|nr:unnamed protein product [Phytomonas sp. Hart1]|eukprot:CCW72262.1 unnamed protein product [Phytomonas sp. isolate Hart1]
MPFMISTRRLGALMVVVLLIGLGMVSPTTGFVFTLKPNTRCCFYDESSSNTKIRIGYKATEAPEQILHVVLSGPNDVVYWEDNRDESVHEFRNLHGGLQTLCFYSSLNRVTRRVPSNRTITLRLGNDFNEMPVINPGKKLKPLEAQLRKIEYAIFGIHNEYLYYKEKEAEMRAANEAMTSKVMWISVMVIVIFLLFSYFQLRHLKSYFRKKRMID